MLIGIDASRANRKFKGGTEWYSYYLIKELAKIDSTNQYILYSDQPLEDGLANLTDNGEEIDGRIAGSIKTVKSPHNNFKAKILSWPFTWLWTQVRLSLEMLIHPPDILFIPAHTLPVIHPKKSLVTIHDIGFERQKELYSTDRLGPPGNLPNKAIYYLARLLTGGKFGTNIIDYHTWSAKHIIKHAKEIIAVSKFTKKELIDVYGAPDSKIKVVYNGYNADLYGPIAQPREKDRIMSKYGILPPYIFYVGRLEKKKNIARLLNAFAILKERNNNLNYRLVLAGNASLGFDELKYIIEEFDLNNEVIITGWVPEEDLPCLYSGASLFIFPSLYEGFGIPLVQAMAMGVPIAASRVASIPEVTAGAALLFNPRDEYDIADKMAKILFDKKLADELIANGSGRVKYFSLEKCARETLDIIKTM